MFCIGKQYVCLKTFVGNVVETEECKGSSYEEKIAF